MHRGVCVGVSYRREGRQVVAVRSRALLEGWVVDVNTNTSSRRAATHRGNERHEERAGLGAGVRSGLRRGRDHSRRLRCPEPPAPVHSASRPRQLPLGGRSATPDDGPPDLACRVASPRDGRSLSEAARCRSHRPAPMTMRLSWREVVALDDPSRSDPPDPPRPRPPGARRGPLLRRARVRQRRTPGPCREVS